MTFFESLRAFLRGVGSVLDIGGTLAPPRRRYVRPRCSPMDQTAENWASVGRAWAQGQPELKSRDSEGKG